MALTQRQKDVLAYLKSRKSRQSVGAIELHVGKQRSTVQAILEELDELDLVDVERHGSGTIRTATVRPEGITAWSASVQGKPDRMAEDLAELRQAVEELQRLVNSDEEEPSKWGITPERLDTYSTLIQRAYQLVEWLKHFH